MNDDVDAMRAKLRERLRDRVRREKQPRLTMALFLLVAGTAWFLSSVAMLRLGVSRMPLRYPLAVGVAYLVFFGLLWGWVRLQRLLGGGAGLLGTGLAASALSPEWDDWGEEPVEEKRPKSKESGAGSLGNFGGGGGGGGDAAEILVVLVLVAAVCTLAVSLYLIAISPMLLAEVLVDGVALAAVSKSIGPGRAPHWTVGVLRRTWLAALATALVFGLVGLGIEWVAPGASTLGQAWQIATASSRRR